MGGSHGDVLTERSLEGSAYTDYRSSHQKPGYGTDYAETFRSGYYAALWSRIGRLLVEGILRPLGGQVRTCLDFVCGTGCFGSVDSSSFVEACGDYGFIGILD